jgi:hypothetical protein
VGAGRREFDDLYKVFGLHLEVSCKTSKDIASNFLRMFNDALRNGACATRCSKASVTKAKSCFEKGKDKINELLADPAFKDAFYFEIGLNQIWVDGSPCRLSSPEISVRAECCLDLIDVIIASLDELETFKPQMRGKGQFDRLLIRQLARLYEASKGSSAKDGVVHSGSTERGGKFFPNLSDSPA